jgi:uncharacterized protein
MKKAGGDFKKHQMKKALLGIVLLYVCLVGVYAFWQELFLFHPVKLEPQYVYKFENNFKEIWLNNNKLLRINGVHFYAKGPSKGVIYYLHGNRGNVAIWAEKIVPPLLQTGYDVFLIDYPTYGKSKGMRNETNLVEAAQMGYNYLKEVYPEYKIVLFGRSLGSGLAVQLAAINRPRQLILETPYTSIPDVAKQWVGFLPVELLSNYNLNTKEVIKNVACPINIFHGTTDWVVFYKHSLELKEKCPKCELHVITGGAHNNLDTFPQYRFVLDSLLKNSKFYNR